MTASGQAFLQIAKKNESVAEGRVGFGKIRVEFDRQPRGGNGLFGIPGAEQNERQGLVRLRARWRQSNRFLGNAKGVLKRLARWPNPPIHAVMDVAKTKQGIGVGKIGIDFDRLIQKGNCIVDILQIGRASCRERV